VREFRTAVEQTEIKAPDGRRLERVTMACEIKDLDEKTGRGVGYLSVYGNEDSYGDVVDEGSMVKTCSERTPSNPLPFLWQHYSDEPIGVYTKLDPRDSYGLRTEFQYALGVQRAREAFELAQMRACHGQSIGWATLKDGKDSMGLRHLKEIRLWEGSQVTFPANDLAGITAVKSGMAQFEGVLELLREIRSELGHAKPEEEVLEEESFDPQTAELASLLAEVKAALGGAAAPTPAQPASATDAELEAIRELRERMEHRLSEVSM
jgi:hypothetical protein